MTKREDEIQARLDAADADLRAQNAWVDFTDHAHDDVAYLLERVRELESQVKNWEIWANNLPSREDCR